MRPRKTQAELEELLNEYEVLSDMGVKHVPNAKDEIGRRFHLIHTILRQYDMLPKKEPKFHPKPSEMTYEELKAEYESLRAQGYRCCADALESEPGDIRLKTIRQRMRLLEKKNPK